MKTLYLHIGTPKTGTSALQSFLLSNSELLESRGACYRQMPWEYPRDASQRRNGHFLIGRVYDGSGNSDQEARNERIEEGMKTVMEWFRTCDTVILSDESLWNALFRKNHRGLLLYLRKFCTVNGISLKIIVYLRRQDEYVISWWKQKIQSGSRLAEWEIFMEHLPYQKLNLDYYAHLCDIADIVGKENVIVRRYEKGRWKEKHETIFSDFLGAIGMKDTDGYRVVQEYVNTSLEPNYAEIKRVMNQILPPGDTRPYSWQSSWLSDIAAKCSELPRVRRYRCDMMSAEERRQFLAVYEDGNRKVAREFLGEDGELFSQESEPLPKWEKNNPVQYDDTLLFVGCGMLSNKRDTIMLEKRVDRLEKNVERHEKEYHSQKEPQKTGMVLGTLRRKRKDAR